jgi:hypothetical protein
MSILSRGQADFVMDRVIIHPSCRLIGRYRSIPSCNRPAFLHLMRLFTVLIIAASAMYQTKSLVTNGRSVGMNTALTIAAQCFRPGSERSAIRSISQEAVRTTIMLTIVSGAVLPTRPQFTA